ncbi:hypothetical protein ACIRQP_42180, partial [Streptomyces sp. NPDC102274]|uniref:hypothetical protein n=1 Tax=Streptomyces sp. NPDC102274 TaxID=3366151 RepID=UPI003809C5A8
LLRGPGIDDELARAAFPLAADVVAEKVEAVVMWTTRVFSGESRSPSGARTSATCSRRASARWAGPLTRTTKSSA